MEIRSLTVGEIGTNCYVLCDEQAGVCAVVDPGAEADRIADAVRESGCRPVSILLTHGHYDHTGAVAELCAAWPGIDVWVSAREPIGSGRLFPALPAGTKRYDEGDTVAVGGLTLTVLATPGHSEGSVSLLCGTVLICGDTLFCGSCGRTDLRGGDGSAMLVSLRRLGKLEGNYTVLPGHMDPTELDYERQTNPYLIQALRTERT